MCRKVIPMTLLLVQMLIITSCATTTFLKSWRDTNYHGQVKKVFVVSVDKDPGRRSLIENEFVRQFKARGTDAVASAEFMSGIEDPKRDVFESKAREQGSDVILVAKFIRKETEDTYTPQGDSGDQIIFSAENDAIVQFPDNEEPERSYIYTISVMQLTLYDTETKKPIWSSRTRTKYQGSRTRQIKPFVDSVLRKLAGEKLIH
ncbi:MAG: hypothetical protein ACHQYP_06265 [Nitrospiria bacterium]